MAAFSRLLREGCCERSRFRSHTPSCTLAFHDATYDGEVMKFDFVL